MRKAHKSKLVLLGIAFSVMPYFVSAAVMPAERGLKQESKTEILEQKEMTKDKIKADREAFRSGTEERLRAFAKRYGEVRSKRIEEFFSNMVRKFEKAIDRLDSLEERIGKHLNKLADRGKDVSELNIQLAEAKNNINEAERALFDAKLKFNAMATSTDPKKTFKDVKTLIGDVATKIREAHAGLVDVINSIKGSSGKATTTAQ